MNVLSKLWNFFEGILKRCVKWSVGLFGRNVTDAQVETFVRFVKFCLVGLSNTAVSLGVYYIFLIFDKSLYIVGNVVGFIVSVLNSYFWNSRFVFNKRDEKGKTLLKTYAAYSTNLVVGTALLYLLVDVLKVSEYIAPFINLVITVPMNYLLNKKWVMK